jgi:arylsulfatase
MAKLKLHFYRQDTMFDPPVKLGIPFIINLYTDPREEKPIADTWVITPMLKMVADFEASVKKHPLIAMGTPDPYTPPR